MSVHFLHGSRNYPFVHALHVMVEIKLTKDVVATERIEMKTLKALLGGTAIAMGLGFASLAPVPAQAQNSTVDLARVIVNVNDIVYRGGQPYYRYGSYGPEDRIIVVREGSRNRYYRNVPRGNAYGYYGHPSQTKQWNQNGKKSQKDRKKWEKERRKQANRYYSRGNDRYDDRRHGRGW